MSVSYPQPAPQTFWGWVELILSWLLMSVIWGLVPLFVTIFFAIAIGMTPDIHNEFRVGMTVLALSLCGTQLFDDIPIPQRQLTKWKWLKNLSIIVIAFGAIVSALNVLKSAPKQISPILVNVDILNTSVAIVFFGALLISFLAFLVRTLAASESFEHAVDARRNNLIAASAANSEVDGIKL